MTEPAPLRRPLLLTGPPAVGGSTVAAALAAARGLCAVVEVGAVHAMVRAGRVEPWRPGAGEGQHRLAAVQSCLLASSFVAAGVEVVLCDVVREAVADIYRTSTAAPFVVALRAPLEVVTARSPGRFTPEELAALHAESALVAADAEVDATADLTAVIAAVEELWAAAPPVLPTT